jgi:hypothetical protein
LAKLEKADIRRHAHEVSRLRGGAFGYDSDGFRDAEAYLDGLVVRLQVLLQVVLDSHFELIPCFRVYCGCGLSKPQRVPRRFLIVFQGQSKKSGGRVRRSTSASKAASPG